MSDPIQSTLSRGIAAESGGRALPRAAPDERAKKSFLAGGGLLGALAMSSCCIVPLVLFSLGITGAWIGNLSALYPYRFYFLVPTVAALAFGFYAVYRKPKPEECAAGSYCTSPVSDRINRIVLWSSSALVVAALAFPYLAPMLLDY